MNQYITKDKISERVNYFNANSELLKACYYYDISEDNFKLILYLSSEDEGKGLKNEVVKIIKGDYNEINSALTNMLMIDKKAPYRPALKDTRILES